MKAIIRQVSLKNVNTKDGRKFDKIVIKCDVVKEEDRVFTRNAEMSVDYAKRYFSLCGYSSADLPGKVCDVTLQKRIFKDANGVDRVIESIKYLNMLDDEGNPIIMRKEADPSMPF